MGSCGNGGCRKEGCKNGMLCKCGGLILYATYFLLTNTWQFVPAAHCTLHTIHNTLHTAWTNIHCTLYPTHYTLPLANCILHTTHCMDHNILHTRHNTLHSTPSTLHTAYWIIGESCLSPYYSNYDWLLETRPNHFYIHTTLLGCTQCNVLCKMQYTMYNAM